LDAESGRAVSEVHRRSEPHVVRPSETAYQGFRKDVFVQVPLSQINRIPKLNGSVSFRFLRSVINKQIHRDVQLHVHLRWISPAGDLESGYVCARFDQIPLSDLDKSHILGSGDFRVKVDPGCDGADDMEKFMLVDVVKVAEESERVTVRVPYNVRLVPLKECKFCSWYSAQARSGSLLKSLSLASRLGVLKVNGKCGVAVNRVPSSLYDGANEVIEGASEVVKNLTREDTDSSRRLHEIVSNAKDNLSSVAVIVTGENFTFTHVGLQQPLEVVGLLCDPPQFMYAI
jgi:hypothetical protein